MCLRYIDALACLFPISPVSLGMYVLVFLSAFDSKNTYI